MNLIKNYLYKILFADKMTIDSTKTMKYYKKYNSIKNKKKFFLLKAILIKKHRKICMKYHSFIPLESKIGSGICFPHGLCGIFISQGATIGDNCTIFHQVTIGSNSLLNSKRYGSPTIGNNVYIGAGAKIVGNVKIGNNVRIGANAVVVEDVPNNATVVISKPRMIYHDEAQENKFVEIGDI